MISDDNRAIKGQIAGVNLSSFLQMIEMEQKTCTIKVFTKKNMGLIFFLNGTLIDSSTTKLKHLDALYDILSWNNIVIEVEKNRFKRTNAINLPLMHILIESAQTADETEKTAGPDDPENSDDPQVINSLYDKNITRRILKNKDFCLEIGSKLLIDFDDRAVSFQTMLVGIEHGKYLLLKAPGLLDRMDENHFKLKDLVIKSLYKGTIYAFRSTVMGIISEPSKLMFIAYPRKIEHHELRAHQRFKCSVVAQTEVNCQERGGVIENISKGGCLCIIEGFSKDKSLTPGPLNQGLLNHALPFRCRFPGSKQDIRFQGEIKNTRKTSDEIAVGVQFICLNSADEAWNTINEYIRLIEYSSENV
jgi:putative hemolysin